MPSLSLAATTFFVAGALAGYQNQLLPRELQVRQGSYVVQGPDQSYQAETIEVPPVPAGTTCESRFGTGYLDCDNRSERLLCYNQSQGFTCCNYNRDKPYACGPGDYCLIDERCCPNGLPAEICAERYNITLPPDFSTNTATTPQAPGSTGAVTNAVVTTPIPLPSPIPDNATVPAGTAAPTGAGPSPPVTPFLGAAGSEEFRSAVDFLSTWVGTSYTGAPTATSTAAATTTAPPDPGPAETSFTSPAPVVVPPVDPPSQPSCVPNPVDSVKDSHEKELQKATAFSATNMPRIRLSPTA
ncbi:MAG: hypothetical protein L6R42_001382 [Xanthoria sp. 1 TBL-2021]|nr:MAG: hypothetical protein L6R42_001382 [Xanthoria sp. 1 TBL-2021]